MVGTAGQMCLCQGPTGGWCLVLSSLPPVLTPQISRPIPPTSQEIPAPVGSLQLSLVYRVLRAQ